MWGFPDEVARESRASVNDELGTRVPELRPVTLRGAASDLLEGAGWRLDLNDGRVIVAAERSGDFIVREK